MCLRRPDPQWPRDLDFFVLARGERLQIWVSTIDQNRVRKNLGCAGVCSAGSEVVGSFIRGREQTTTARKGLKNEEVQAHAKQLELLDDEEMVPRPYLLVHLWINLCIKEGAARIYPHGTEGYGDFV